MNIFKLYNDSVPPMESMFDEHDIFETESTSENNESLINQNEQPLITEQTKGKVKAMLKRRKSRILLNGFRCGAPNIKLCNCI